VCVIWWVEDFPFLYRDALARHELHLFWIFRIVWWKAYMSKTHVSKRLGKRGLKNMQANFCNYKWQCPLFLNQKQNKIKILSQASANSPSP
jgi:hypothetical protein